MAAMTDEIKVYDEGYPSRRLFDLIGDKWTPIIVYLLGQGTKRYGELQRHLPDVSKKMLTQTLRSIQPGPLGPDREIALVEGVSAGQRSEESRVPSWLHVVRG